MIFKMERGREKNDQSLCDFVHYSTAKWSLSWIHKKIGLDEAEKSFRKFKSFYSKIQYFGNSTLFQLSLTASDSDRPASALWVGQINAAFREHPRGQVARIGAITI